MSWLRFELFTDWSPTTELRLLARFQDGVACIMILSDWQFGAVVGGIQGGIETSALQQFYQDWNYTIEEWKSSATYFTGLTCICDNVRFLVHKVQ